jgi:hypothetical protein
MTVEVHIRELVFGVLIDDAVTVVILPVAHVGRNGMCRGTEIIAVVATIPGSIRVDVAAAGVREHVSVRITYPEGPDVAVLIVIQGITDFGIPGIAVSVVVVAIRSSTGNRGKPIAIEIRDTGVWICIVTIIAAA